MTAELVDAAVRAADRLCADAVWDGGAATWFGDDKQFYEGSWEVVHRSVDGDLYGDETATPIVDCAPPGAGFVTNGSDCDVKVAPDVQKAWQPSQPLPVSQATKNLSAISVIVAMCRHSKMSRR